MKITNIKIYQLAIPFSLAISHNLADRKESEAIVVIAESDNGFIGVGEGTPRQYVTNETLPECIDAALKMGGQLIHKELGDSSGLNQILDTVSSQPIAQQNPSAWCAVELACLDLFAKSRNIPLWQLFADTPVNETFTYSAVIPLLSSQGLNTVLPVIKSLDMQFVKVKVANMEDGVEYLSLIRKALGPGPDIRIDANGAFSAGEAIEFEKLASSLKISSFEQPVDKEDMEGFQEVTEQGTWQTIADESMCNQSDMENLIRNRGCSGFNVRLSKCGGFRESLKLWNHALAKGCFCQLGCHVGETGVLAAAGRHLAALCRDIKYLEGGYTRFVLESDICTEDVHFGYQGKAGLLDGHGLGVNINEEVLEKWGTLVSSKV
jgi:L-Ala-D/L-Glu epimerase